MARTKAQQAEAAEALERLRELVKVGDTVYTILRHVSTSGMRRVIQPAIVVDGEVVGIGYAVAKVLGDRWDGERQGIVSQGAGMDMGYAMVYSLGAALWPNGTPTPHGERNGEPDSTGGYALKHRWL